MYNHPLVPVQPSLLQILMPPLQEEWASIPDTDRELQPLFECFTSLATALGVLFSCPIPQMEMPQPEVWVHSGETLLSKDALDKMF